MLDKKPYLIDAFRNWIIDSNHTPYILVNADGAQVPPSRVKNGKIVLNISHTSTNLYCANAEALAFDARFGGVSFSIFIPMKNIIAIYPKELPEEGYFFESFDTEKDTPTVIPADATFDFGKMGRNVSINTDAVGTNGAKITLPDKPLRPALSVVKKTDK